jgi:trans-aconitate methyltransferase
MEYFDQAAANYNAASQRWPWSWLRGREARALLELSGDVKGADVLDLGSGSGYYSLLFLNMGARHVTAVDSSPNMIEALGNDVRIETVNTDVENLDLKKRFPVIVCAGLLEFVADARITLLVAREHADKGSAMVVLVPCDNFWGALYRLFHRCHGLDISLYRPTSFRALAETTGWMIKEERRVWPFTYEFGMRAK